MEALRLAPPRRPHHLDIVRVARKVEANNDDQVCQNKDTALEVIALSFTVNVAEQENTQDNSDHIELREYEVEGVVDKVLGIHVLAVHGTEENESWDL